MPENTWDEETDVIVVGYGGAGAVAAIAAHDAGARVTILEKQPADTPTKTNHTPSTRMSGGWWLCPGDEDKAVQYIEVTLDDIEAANHLANEVLGRTLDELSPQTRRLLMLLDQMVTEACKRFEMDRSDYRFSRRDVRQYTGWSDF